MPCTADQVRELAASLPRSYEVFVRGRWKFRVKQIVYIAFSKDETLMGFAFPKEERQMLVETYPEKFMYPRESDMRFNWVVARLKEMPMIPRPNASLNSLPELAMAARR